jgi:GLPGLI family protein
MKYQEDSLNPNFKPQEDMVLFLGKKISKYMSYNFYIGDSMVRKVSSFEEFEKLTTDLKNPLPFVKFQIELFKNYPIGKLTCLDHIIGGSFKYEEEMDLFKWQLKNDTTSIMGYKVQKATCKFGGRNWIAWFCPDLPYNDGPYKFHGLPGLIVKVNDTRFHYLFEMTSIKKPGHELKIDITDRSYIETTKQGFFKAQDAFRNDIISRAKDAGFNSEEQQAMARRMAQKNNPIELK